MIAKVYLISFQLTLSDNKIPIQEKTYYSNAINSFISDANKQEHAGQLDIRHTVSGLFHFL